MDPSGVLLLVDVFDQLYSNFPDDVSSFDARLNEIEATLGRIERNMGDDVLAELRRGKTHLRRSLTAETVESANEELSQARQVFASLASRSPEGETVTSKGPVSNRSFVVQGHCGNFYYFVMKRDFTNAAVEAYSSTELDPVTSLEIFPQELYSKPYRKARKELVGRTAALSEALAKRQRANTVERLKYYGKVAAKVGASAGALAAGLAATVIHPLSVYAGGRAAMAIWETDVGDPTIMDVNELRAELKKHNSALSTLDAQLHKECIERRKSLERGPLRIEDRLAG